MRLLKPIAAAAALLAASGCISTSDFESVQRQVVELQEELANVKRTASSKEEVQGVNTKIAEQTETLLKSNAMLVAKVDEIEKEIQGVQDSTDKATYRVDQVAQQLAQAQRDLQDLRTQLTALQAAPAPATTPTPAGGTLTVPGAPAPPPADPMQTYQAAYRDYQRGNYDLAIEGFRQFVDENPKSDMADNAAYWVGESLFSQKKYRDAIEQFDNLITKYPKSDKVPGALLKKGYAYIALGERAQGIVQLQYVVHEHPKSQEATLARQRLKQLGVDTQ
jgi:tol-pal system protein YbgF